MKQPDRKAVEIGSRHRDGRRRRLVGLSRIVFALNVALVVAGVILRRNLMAADSGEYTYLVDVLIPIGIVIANGMVALLILSRYARQTVGWLLLLLSFTSAFSTFSDPFGFLYDHSLPGGSALLAWINLWIWLPLPIIPILFIPLYFPDGRLLSPRWRFAAVFAVMGLLTGIASFAIHPGPFVLAGASALNPYHIARGASVAEFLWQYVTLPLLLISLAGVVGSLVRRYLQSDRSHRAQMKWVLYAFIAAFALNFAFAVPFLLGWVPAAMQTTWNDLSNMGVFLLAIALPAAIGIAILRYRLYDIDIIIRRTLVYSLVTLTLAVVYFGSVVLLQRLFTSLSGEQSPVAIVISTLIIAALFSPLRRRMQGLIDRRFYRRHYDAVKTLAAFGAVARDEVDLETLRRTLLGAVEETMQPVHLSLWMAPSRQHTTNRDSRQRGGLATRAEMSRHHSSTGGVAERSPGYTHE